jgi:hypothetical protein
MEGTMKKKLLAILLPLALTVACSLAVWANDGTVQPPCPKCAKVAKEAPCGNCAKDVKPAECEKCARQKLAQAEPCGGEPCEKCAKAQQVEKPCCAKGAKDQQPAVKPCCDLPKKQ